METPPPAPPPQPPPPFLWRQDAGAEVGTTPSTRVRVAAMIMLLIGVPAFGAGWNRITFTIYHACARGPCDPYHPEGTLGILLCVGGAATVLLALINIIRPARITRWLATAMMSLAAIGFVFLGFEVLAPPSTLPIALIASFALWVVAGVAGWSALWSIPESRPARRRPRGPR